MAASTMGRARALPGTVYVWIGWASVLIAFGGFTPTFWAPVASGALHIPVAHIFHGLLFFSWTLVYLAQASAIAGRNIAFHRGLGMASISLATAMSISVVLAAIASMEVHAANGFAVEGQIFSIVQFVGVGFFATVFALAIVNLHRPDVHKRLMTVAAVSLLPAAIARVIIVLFIGSTAGGPPPPVAVTVPPSLLANLLIVAAMAHDWRTRGSVHPIYWKAGGALLAVQILIVPLSETAVWIAIAGALRSLGG